MNGIKSSVVGLSPAMHLNVPLCSPRTHHTTGYHTIPYHPYRVSFQKRARARNIQRAIMEVLFRPAIEDANRRESEKGFASESAGDSGTDTSPSLSLAVRRPESPDLDGVLGGAAAVRRRWELQESSKAFSCMLWCTIAIGAMTSNLRTTTVSILTTKHSTSVIINSW